MESHLYLPALTSEYFNEIIEVFFFFPSTKKFIFLTDETKSQEWEPVLEKWECALHLTPLAPQSFTSSDPAPLPTTPSFPSFSTLVTSSDPSLSTSSSLPYLDPITPQREDVVVGAEIGRNISIVSPRILNINFSKQMVSALLRTMKAWKEEEEEEEENFDQVRRSISFRFVDFVVSFNLIYLLLYSPGERKQRKPRKKGKGT